MLPEPLLRLVRRLTLKARRAARERLAGAYESGIRGAGLTFAEVRTYQPGDDIRHIDWNVTARTGSPHVKRFVEERERIVWLLVDASASQAFGVSRTKRQTAAEVAALVGFAASAQGDRIGLIHFTDRPEQVLLAKKGERHARRVSRELFTFEPAGTGTSLTAALSLLRHKRRSVVFLVSDFRDPACEPALRVAARKHDLIGVCVSDPAEEILPNVGLVRVTDAEAGGQWLINTADSRVRAAYNSAAQARRAAVKNLLRSAGADRVEISTAGGHLEALIEFFHRRERRR